ncbi:MULTISPECIES: ribonuclease D [unclassified Corynebacterium]|uniref:ribonuclease D n=1 Tax=unclassified Corynebacterium TaxID=2624378 RepID=UPI0029C9C155|nr:MULTISPECIES: HRDC domain-containing protein [unclassified Corynebacterium]WPF65219.1 HRDC domain-containing protein [Corynebacterium sp. 22KM0430]WPF67714.1 HRDC domain-containing protein [Corynebacterium sp. 21KM1197]
MSARPLLAPREGTPPLLRTPEEFRHAAHALARGRGPFAVDTERASAYRYDDRVFLLQVRRRGAGTFLFAPEGHRAELREALSPVLDGAQWVLHAAPSDLPSLLALGLRPGSLFDTELASRLAGFERVNLASMTEELCGYTLAKGHGAEDWSTTPLPQEWLAYAALDVETLLDLAETLTEILDQQGKLSWLEQDCAALIATTALPQRRWTALKGLGRLHHPADRARARALWRAREELAKRTDAAPGTLLPDKVLLAIATDPPTHAGHLWKVPGYSRRYDEHNHTWMEALRQARALDPAEYPPAPAPPRIPGHSRWAQVAPAAAAVLDEAKEAFRLHSEELGTPMENLLRPKIMRAVIWEAVEEQRLHDSADLRAALGKRGARPWQQDLAAAVLGPLLW